MKDSQVYKMAIISIINTSEDISDDVIETLALLFRQRDYSLSYERKEGAEKIGLE